MQRSTSDLKTAVGRDFADETGAQLNLGRPYRAGYATGMWAEESSARAKKPVIELHRMTGRGTLRRVTTWLPIHHLTTDELWQLHQDHGIVRHPAYDMGMRRLSCRACPLAKTEDLIRSAQLNPALFAEYAQAEKEMGKPFKKSHQTQGDHRAGSGLTRPPSAAATPAAAEMTPNGNTAPTHRPSVTKRRDARRSTQARSGSRTKKFQPAAKRHSAR
ncbi:phosphoadenosine phosphosulfate reductase family protein [Streptomyces sp. NPDC056367]|uniref:phosphoadenosine phosphosulfate reductase domain-containing protein n=1 Tax=Streptomyces sp. NPDC056367 TaxID=3345797 RepID=UPI0035E1D7B5